MQQWRENSNWAALPKSGLSPSPILTIHSLSTQTGYRSVGPCSKPNSQHLQDVTLFPHSVPGQKGWWKVLQKPNTYKKRKSIIIRVGIPERQPSLKYIPRRKRKGIKAPIEYVHRCSFLTETSSCQTTEAMLFFFPHYYMHDSKRHEKWDAKTRPHPSVWGIIN